LSLEIILAFLSLILSWPWSIVAAIVSIIIAIIIIYDRYKRWKNTRAIPHIKTSILLNPLHDKETYVDAATVPERKRIILYFAIQALDNRTYDHPSVWVYFRGPFNIIYNATYDKFSFGKVLEPQKTRESLLNLNRALIRDKNSPLVFPIVVETPQVGEYDVEIEFVSQGVGKKSRKETLHLKCATDGYSQNEKFFDPNTFLHH
jgi:hypothetical protein